MMVLLSIRSFPMEIPASSHPVTSVPNRTSAPNCSSARSAERENDPSLTLNSGSVDQYVPRRARTDGSEVRRERAFRQFGDRSGQLDPGRPATDVNEDGQCRGNCRGPVEGRRLRRSCCRTGRDLHRLKLRAGIQPLQRVRSNPRANHYIRSWSLVASLGRADGDLCNISNTPVSSNRPRARLSRWRAGP